MHAPMKVYMTFDIEVWCNGWNNLDAVFPAAFERYIYGRSPKGEFALPKTLEILDSFGLKGVFFVEPLFARRFGVGYLTEIVALIKSGGHEVQLHLHPEWTDEIRPLVFSGATRKRQHLAHYSLKEQCALITLGQQLLEEAGSGPIVAFRAGSFAANADTYRALRQCGIAIDSSLNAVHPDSGLDLRGRVDFHHRQVFENVQILPMTVFRDGLGRCRPAQVGACSFAEMRDALLSAQTLGIGHFVLLSHNFEMLRQASSVPDGIVVGRFQRLCEFLAAYEESFDVSGFSSLSDSADSQATLLPYSRLQSTLWRHGEQLIRRLLG